jgi:AcrR family transcriptional regulator
VSKTASSAKASDPDLGIARKRQIKNKALVAERRAQIKTAALDLFLKKGFNSTTIADIAAASGVNRASLYDYVKNKDHILELLFQDMHAQTAEGRIKLAPDIQPTDIDSLEEYLRQGLGRAWTAYPDVALLAYRETHALNPAAKKRTMMADLEWVKFFAAKFGQICGLDQDDPRPFIIAAVMIFLHSFMALKGWMMRDCDPDQIRDVVVGMLVSGLRDLAKAPETGRPKDKKVRH